MLLQFACRVNNALVLGVEMEKRLDFYCLESSITAVTTESESSLEKAAPKVNMD